MSALEQDHLNPNNPNYYAPRWLREKPESPTSPSVTASEPVKNPIATSATLDHQLENAVSDALRWRFLLARRYSHVVLMS